jgi:hypothetical protein
LKKHNQNKKKSNQKKGKRKMTNKIFIYLQNLIAKKWRKIIHQNNSLGIKMQELSPKENYAHQNKEI